MAAEDRIECRSCGRAVVPQFWVDGRNGLEHPTVRHLCPLCGATLFVSGGGMNWTMLALIIRFSVLAFLIIILAIVFSRP
jgi:ribosomal protein S27E